MQCAENRFINMSSDAILDPRIHILEGGLVLLFRTPKGVYILLQSPSAPGSAPDPAPGSPLHGEHRFVRAGLEIVADGGISVENVRDVLEADAGALMVGSGGSSAMVTFLGPSGGS